MGIQLLIVGVILLVLSLILSIVRKNALWILVLLLIIPVAIGSSLAISTPPTTEYPYSTTITLNNNATTIYFVEYQQNGNEITIDRYCQRAWHWGDFKGYDEVNTPITITLLDNGGKFIYTDRVTDETFNQNKIATQP